MRFLFFLLFLSLVSMGCVRSASSHSTPSCSLSQTLEPLALTPSSIPEATDVVFDQKALIQLMTYTQNDSTCFVQIQQNVTLEKIPRARATSNNEFSQLALAPPDRQNFWRQKEQGGSLMGLTIFSFVESETVQELKHTAILVTDTVRPWHLWHEFSHYLIGKSRLSQPHRRFTSPPPKQLKDARENLERMSQQLLSSPDADRSDEFARKIQAYVELVFRDLDFNHVHEIIIELTLTELVLQMPQDRVTTHDLVESTHMTATNLQIFLEKWRKAKADLFPLIRPHFNQPQVRSAWLNSSQKMESYGEQLEQLVHRQHRTVHNLL